MNVNLKRAELLCILVILTSAAYLLANDYNKRRQIANRINAKYDIRLNLYGMSIDNMLTYEKARDDLEMEVNILRMKTLDMLRKRDAMIEQHKTIGSEQLLLYNDNFHKKYVGTYNNTAFDMNHYILSPRKSDEEHWYKSISGMEYKYDLSRPRDKILYDLDIKAKMYDDIMGNNPRVEMDLVSDNLVVA